MADNDSIREPSGLADALSSVMSDPALMEKLSGILNSTAGADTDGGSGEAEKKPSDRAPASGIGDVLSDPSLMAKLPEVIAVLRPMLEGGGKKEEPPKNERPGANSKRLALLYALKPYLSPRRCEAIDYFARMSKMGDMIKNIKL